MRLNYKTLMSAKFIVLTFLLGSVASAQDLEPNSVCASAQDAGMLMLPAVLDGSIAGPNPAPPSDVDFYRFTATPGLRLRLTGDQARGARAGAFREGCAGRLAAPEIGVNWVDFTVPDSGVFVIAVAERFDEDFNGRSATNSGPYAVSVALAPLPIGSISGRLVDSVTRKGIPGGVSLSECFEGRPCGFLGVLVRQNTEEVADGTGAFRLETDPLGRPILSGDFLLEIAPDDRGFVQSFSTLRFSVAAGQNLDLGDILFTPSPVVLSNIRPCTGLPAQGGVCRYSVNVRNNMATTLTGQAFSPVQVGPGNLDSDPVFLGTTFEANALLFESAVDFVTFRSPLGIPGGGGSQDVTFLFKVPPFVPEQTMICAQVKIGLDPTPLFNVKAEWLLFCLAKESSGYRTMSSEESRAALARMQETGAQPMLR